MKQRSEGNKGSGLTPAQQLAMKKANRNRTDAAGRSGMGASSRSLDTVTSNIPSVYQPGNSPSLSRTPGARGVRTEPTRIVKISEQGVKNPWNEGYGTQVRSGYAATDNFASPGRPRKR